jgi:signal-transduction protein with cAMP-binding, CBS, and nucleotidyltransferase domain
MVQNSTIGVDCLIQVLGTEISAPDLTQIQAQIQVLPVLPGTSFWRSSNSPAGIYIVLAGKVRLFDLQGERVATLNAGRSFGESTLFPDAILVTTLPKLP